MSVEQLLDILSFIVLISSPQLLVNDESSTGEILSSVFVKFELSFIVLISISLLSDSSFLAAFFLSFKSLILMGKTLGRTLSEAFCVFEVFEFGILVELLNIGKCFLG